MPTLSEPLRSSAPTVDAAVRPRHLEYLPISLFGSVMGLTGLSVAWTLASARYAVSPWIAEGIAIIAIAAFVALLAGYVVKLMRAPAAVVAEFRHPIAGNLFGTLLISLLLLPIVVARWNLLLARIAWAIGALGMLLFAWLIVSRWMTHRQQPAHATPAWIIPIVGMLDVPLALPSLQLGSLSAIMLLSLAVGLFFALPLFTLILSRLIFEAPMPDALQPSLLILVAPFSVGFSTYVLTVGQIDRLAQALYFLMLFILAVLLGRLRMLRHCCPFRVSWWAVSFPLAASAIAALRYAAFDPNWFTVGVAWALLTLGTVTIGGLLVRTLLGIAQGELPTLST